VSNYTSRTVEPEFERWLSKDLNEYEQSVFFASVTNILEVQGPDICKSEFGKPVGDGVFEFRIRQSLNAINNYGKTVDDDFILLPGGDKTVLLRVFVHFYGDRIVLLMHGLNKGTDNSEKRQNKEIKRAKSILKKWKSEEAKRKKAAK
jgi:putative component of toxin-antitoxin plasmid stabilization module